MQACCAGSTVRFRAVERLPPPHGWPMPIWAPGSRPLVDVVHQGRSRPSGDLPGPRRWRTWVCRSRPAAPPTRPACDWLTRSSATAAGENDAAWKFTLGLLALRFGFDMVVGARPGYLGPERRRRLRRYSRLAAPARRAAAGLRGYYNIGRYSRPAGARQPILRGVLQRRPSICLTRPGSCRWDDPVPALWQHPGHATVAPPCGIRWCRRGETASSPGHR